MADHFCPGRRMDRPSPDYLCGTPTYRRQAGSLRSTFVTDWRSHSSLRSASAGWHPQGPCHCSGCGCWAARPSGTAALRCDGKCADCSEGTASFRTHRRPWPRPSRSGSATPAPKMALLSSCSCFLSVVGRFGLLLSMLEAGADDN